MWATEPYTLDLADVIRLSDDDLFKLCGANPDLRIERNAAGQLEIALPAGLKSSARATEIIADLVVWKKLHGDGIVFDGTAGFFLPNGAMRVPDASWASNERWNAVPEEQQEKFARLVPEFVLEVRSPSDRLPPLLAKMKEWIENGCRLAWLIDPTDQRARIYRADGSTEDAALDVVLSGEDVLPGFSFDLKNL